MKSGFAAFFLSAMLLLPWAAANAEWQYDKWGNHIQPITAVKPEIADWQTRLAAGESPDHLSDDGYYTILTAAILHEDIDFCRFIIENGADVDLEMKAGYAPIIMAAHHANADICRLLVESGAKLDATGPMKNTVLYYALLNRSLEPFKYLIETDATDLNTVQHLNTTPFARLFFRTDVPQEYVEYLIREKGADVNRLPQSLAHELLDKRRWEMCKCLLGHHPKAAEGKYRRNLLTLLENAANRELAEACDHLMGEMKISPEGQRVKDINLLKMAAKRGNRELCEVFLKHGLPMNEKDGGEVSPLMCAILSGNRETVEFFLSRGATRNTVTRFGETAMHAAVRTGDVEMCRLLAREGAWIAGGRDAGRFIGTKKNVKPNLLLLAVDSGNAAVCEFLLEAGVDVNAPETQTHKPFQVTAPKMTTALHLATEKMDWEVFTLLLRYGADVNARDECQRTPLHTLLFQMNKQPELAKLRFAQELVLRGVDVAAKDEVGTLAGDAKFVPPMLQKYLRICAGKDTPEMNAPDADGESPLHYAVRAGRLDTCRQLLESGASVATKNQAGQTPLHFAAAFGDAEILALLLKHGAAVNVTDEEGMTALHLAAISMREDCLRMLLDAGANPNLYDKHFPAFYYALLNAWLSGCKSLLEHGFRMDRLLVMLDGSQSPGGPGHFKGSGRLLEKKVWLTLLACGVDLNNVRAQVWRTPLDQAIETANLADCIFLLDHGMNPYSLGERKHTHMHHVMEFSTDAGIQNYFYRRFIEKTEEKMQDAKTEPATEPEGEPEVKPITRPEVKKTPDVKKAEPPNRRGILQRLRRR